MDYELSRNIFDDRRITRSVRDCEVADAGLAVGEDRSKNREWLLSQLLHRLSDRGIRIEHVLRPATDREIRPTGDRLPVIALGQIEDVGNEPLFVHAVDGGDAVKAHPHRAILARPHEALGPGISLPLHPPREAPELRGGILHPIHRPADDHAPVGKAMEATGAGRGRPADDHNGNHGAKHRAQQTHT